MGGTITAEIFTRSLDISLCSMFACSVRTTEWTMPGGQTEAHIHVKPSTEPMGPVTIRARLQDVELVSPMRTPMTMQWGVTGRFWWQFSDVARWRLWSIHSAPGTKPLGITWRGFSRVGGVKLYRLKENFHYINIHKCLNWYEHRLLKTLLAAADCQMNTTY